MTTNWIDPPLPAQECPDEIAPLRGIFAPKPVTERTWESVEAEAESQSLSDRIDDISWDAWGVSTDPRLTEDGVDACGCRVFKWHRADNSKSVTLHSDCTVGNGAHVWSGTMRTDLQIDEHLSRLDLSAAMREVTRAEAAAAVGLLLGPQREHRTFTPADLERDADRLQQQADAAGAAGGDPEELLVRAAVTRAAAAGMRQALAASGFVAQVPPEYRVDGAVSFAPPIGTPLTVVDAGGRPEDAAAAAAEAEAERINDIRDPYRHLPDPCAEELEDAVFSFPEAAAIRDAARAGAMSPWSVLGLSIGRGLLRVHPSVSLPALVGGQRAPLNVQLGLVGASGRGKGGANGIVDYGVTERLLGLEFDKMFQPPSGAALANLYVQQHKVDGEVVVDQIRDAAWCDWSEVDTLTAQSGRGGNDLASELRAAITGATLGTDTKGDGQAPLKVPALAYRILVSFSTQYGKPAAGLLGEKDGGTLQRTIWFSTTDPRSLDKRPRGVRRVAEIDILRKLPDGKQITVAEEIHDEVWEAQAAKIRFDRDLDELAGHQNLNRLRVAAWRTLTQQRTHIDLADWAWAEKVVEHSTRVRNRVEASVKMLKRNAAVESGGLDFDRKNAAEIAKAAHTEKLLDALAAWARDCREGRNAHGRKQGPRFTLRDIKASAKNSRSERYIRASELAAELLRREAWVADVTHMWSVEADPELSGTEA